MTGYRGSAVRDIAAHAGVSVGTVMQFGGKAGLLVAVVDDWIAAIHRDAARAHPEGPARQAGADLAEDVSALLRPFLRRFLGEQELSREYAAVLLSGEHRSEVFSGLADTLRTELLAVLGAHDVVGARADDAVETLYLSYLGLLFTLGGEPHSDPDAELDRALGRLRAVARSLTAGDRDPAAGDRR